MTSDEQTEVECISEALNELLTAAVASRAVKRPWVKPRPIGARVWTFQEATDISARDRELREDVEDLINDPTGWCVRKGIKRLGKRLFDIGGTDLMRTVLNDVTDRGGRDEGRWMDILDKRWNGIGREGDIWLA